MTDGITLIGREATLQDQVYPREGNYVPRFISPASEFAVGPQFNQHLSHVDLSFAGSAVYPTANLALCFPFYCPANMTVVDAWTRNGATASGNLDVGIYDSSFALVVSTGAVAQAGTDVFQVVALADTKLYAGRNYWMAISHSNTTGTYCRDSIAGSTTIGARIGCFQAATQHPLTGPITPANFATAYVPFFGFTTETSW